MNPTSKKYFNDKGISVSFDTLARTPTLISAYIENTQDIVSQEAQTMSENVKHACYSQFYTFTERARLTGFEGFFTMDMKYRLNVADKITEAQVRPTKIVDKAPTSHNFKQVLIDSFSDFTKPIYLYLSGGLDSELVANALLDAKKQFTPVIFRWTNAEGVVQNDEETQNAIAFCAAKGLTPHIEVFDLETYWLGTDIVDLSIATSIASPQLTTHCMMVNLIESKFPGVQHVFGGEVRYRTNYIKWDDVTPANIVLLGKITPLSSGHVGVFMRASIPMAAYNQLPITTSNIGAYIASYIPASGARAQLQLLAGNQTVTGLTIISTSTYINGTTVPFPYNDSLAIPPLYALGYESRIVSVSTTTPTPIGNPGNGVDFGVHGIPGADLNWHGTNGVTTNAIQANTQLTFIRSATISTPFVYDAELQNTVTIETRPYGRATEVMSFTTTFHSRVSLNIT